LFSEHVGDCLSPCHRLCPLGLNIPTMLRHIQAGELDDAAALVREVVPLSAILGRLCHHPCEQGCRRGTWDGPAAIRDLEKLVSDRTLGLEAESFSLAHKRSQPVTHKPPAVRRPPTGKSVVIVGTGPTGLAAAWHLLRHGDACTLVDRHQKAGGSLRHVPGEDLTPRVLDAELAALISMGAQFKFGAALGLDLTISGLLLGFDAVLLAPGEISKSEGEAIGLAMTPGGIKVDISTGQTSQPRVFAAGRAVKPVGHLVKAIAEGVTAAENLHQFLTGEQPWESSKLFSNVMGRLDPAELDHFLENSEASPRVNPCDACAGFNRKEAALEASRCLHCDCRASGHCELQRYAQLYQVNASRYRQHRPRFEQLVQPGGVIFEPGKCIRCGICVKLTELAREPLGLTFIGRGFQVRVAAPFNETIEAGLRITAKECVKCCPTGALALTQENREPIPA